MNKDLKFSFWNYAPFGIVKNQEAVKDWVELNSNLPMSFIYDFKTDKKEDVLSLLDECQKNNLKLIISDSRTLFSNLCSMSKEEFRSLVKAAYDDFGHHKAAFGFYIGDEPSPAESDLFITAMQIVLEEMPGLTPFGNLLPYFCITDCENKDYDYYEKLLDRILKESKAPVIGFDHYAQCFDDLSDQKRGLESYFIGLDEYRKICNKHNVPFYMSLLSVGHWQYRVPTEDDIRWQISTAFAHGARGIVWFYVYQNDDDLSYRMSPFTNFDLKKTPMFDIVAREQHLFRMRNEKLLNKMELVDVYHLNNSYHGSKTFKPDEYVEKIVLDRELPVIISYFQEFDSEKKWVSFVNCSQKYANLFRLTFKGGHQETFWLAPGEMRLLDLDLMTKHEG